MGEGERVDSEHLGMRRFVGITKAALLLLLRNFCGFAGKSC